MLMIVDTVCVMTPKISAKDEIRNPVAVCEPVSSSPG